MELVTKIIDAIFSTSKSLFEAKAVTIDPGALNLPTSFGSLGDLVSAALPLVVTTTGLLMFGYLILGGIKYVTASGDSKQIQEAVKTITGAVIGLAIVFGSFWIVRIIETVFGLKITGVNR